MSNILLIGSLPQENNQPIPQKWALFDLDWTLIRPNRRKLHTKGNGWSWLPNVLSRLQDFVRDDYTIGIVTNARPWRLQTVADISQRLTQVHQDLQTYVCAESCYTPIMAGLTDKEYRKPGIGWLNHISLLPGSLMVGDAAGRPCDFSDSDRIFAENAGIPFYTPEEVFSDVPGTIFGTIPEEVLSMSPVFLILMGAPGSGKTTFAQQLAEWGWIRISSDDYNSNFKRIYSAVESALQTGKQVVIDATNPTKARRQQYQQLANSYKVPSAIVHFLNPGEDRNKCRAASGGKEIPKIAYNTYWKNYQPPDPEKEIVYEVI